MLLTSFGEVSAASLVPGRCPVSFWEGLRSTTNSLHSYRLCILIHNYVIVIQSRRLEQKMNQSPSSPFSNRLSKPNSEVRWSLSNLCTSPFDTKAGPRFTCLGLSGLGESATNYTHFIGNGASRTAA